MRLERQLRIGDEVVAQPIKGPDGRGHVELDCTTGELVTLGADALAAIAEPLPAEQPAPPDPVADLQARVDALERDELARQKAAAPSGDMPPAAPPHR